MEEEDGAGAIATTATYSGPLSRHLPLPLLVLITILATLIILLTVLGNLLVLRFKAKVGRTNTTLLVWNLGLTDFLVGVFVLPLGALYLIQQQWMFGRLMCRLWVAMDVTFCTCSVVTICVISVDRYLAVTRPLQYKSYVTKNKVICALVLIWAFSSCILLSTVRWEHDNEEDDKTLECYAGHEIRYLAHSVVFAFFLPASVTLTLYWRIYRLARNRQRALDRGFLMILGHNMNLLTSTLSQNTALRVHVGKDNGMVEHQRRVLRTHERIAKTLGVVSTSFLFCWLPFFSLYLTNYCCMGCIPTVAIDIASWLGYCNSMINPIIYSFTVKEFKRSTLHTVLPLWCSLHRLCPRLVPKAPDRGTVRRINRNMADNKGNKSRGAGKQKRQGNTASKRSAIRRRATEPTPYKSNSRQRELADKRSEARKLRGVIIEEEENEDEEGYGVEHTIDAREETFRNSSFRQAGFASNRLNSDGLLTTLTDTLPPPLGNAGSMANFTPNLSQNNYYPASDGSSSSDVDEDEIIRMPCRHHFKRHSLPGGGGGGGGYSARIGRLFPLGKSFKYQDRTADRWSASPFSSAAVAGRTARGASGPLRLHGYVDSARSWITRRGSQRARREVNNNSDEPCAGYRRRQSEGNAITSAQKERQLAVAVIGGVRAVDSLRLAPEITLNNGSLSALAVSAPLVEDRDHTGHTPTAPHTAHDATPRAMYGNGDRTRSTIRLYCLTNETNL